MKKFNIRIVAVAVLMLCGGMGWAQSAKAQTDPFVGQIIYVGFNFCPTGWAAAEGQLLPVSQNTALFSLLGTTYGGDGQTTFALPDLRGRVPVHAGTGPGLSALYQGEQGGDESQTLTFAQMPSHAHTATTSFSGLQVTSVLRGSTSAATAASPAGASLAVAKKETYSSNAPTTSMAAGSVQSTVTGGEVSTTVDATNSGTAAVSVRDPFLGLRACIALYGIFPSQ
jgi:microcystin-dependent protein